MKLKDWYGFTKRQRCCACGSRDFSEAAHVRAVLSSKTGDRLPRSHKGRAAWSCIPLCKPCHLQQHEEGEQSFSERNRLDYGSIIATNLIRFFVEGEQ